jgi:hypothetical protein
MQITWSKFLAAHRAHAPRRLRASGPDRAVIFARGPEARRWIDHELFAEGIACEYVDTLSDLVTSLTLVPPPWPQYLILDVAELSDTDVDVLVVIRATGWPGMIVALGLPSKPLQTLLDIDVVLPRTFAIGSELLRTTVRTIGADRRTMPMRRLAR